MFPRILILQTVSLMITIRAINGGFVPDLNDYSPTDDSGNKYQAKTAETAVWQHLVARSRFKPNDLAMSVADFLTEDEKDCVRVVVFSGDMAALEDVKVSCDSPEPFLGLFVADDLMWYYGTVFARRIMDKSYSLKETYSNKFAVVKANDGSMTCDKTWWIVVERHNNERGYGYSNVPFAKSPNTVKVEEDPDCEEVISQKSFPSMLLYSPKGDVRGKTPSDGLLSLNSMEAVGATVREYRKGIECFQLLTLTSRGRPLTAMKMSCGPLQGVSLTDRILYYGNTVMIKVHDDLKTFTVFYLPSSEGKQTMCVTNTVGFAQGKEGDIVKKLSTTLEYTPSDDCKSLKERNFQGASWLNNNERLKLVQSSTKDRLEQAHPDLIKSLQDYTCMDKVNDFNTGSEMGAIILPCHKGGDKQELVLPLARGQPLTPMVVAQREAKSLVIRGDVLQYNSDVMVKKSSKDADVFEVLVSNGGSGCFKVAHTLKTADGKTTMTKNPGNTVDKQNDSDCKALLEGTTAPK